MAHLTARKRDALFSCALLGLFGLAAWSDGICAKQTADALYVRAIGRHSTSANFVLVTIVNDRTGARRQRAVAAPFLEGAIHSEYHLSYEEAHSTLAEEIALSTPDRVFHFSNTEALNNLPITYTSEELAEARQWLQGYSHLEILLDLRSRHSTLARFYQRRGGSSPNAYRDALAHALLERGLLPEKGCFTYLTVSSPQCERLPLLGTYLRKHYGG